VRVGRLRVLPETAVAGKDRNLKTDLEDLVRAGRGGGIMIISGMMDGGVSMDGGSIREGESGCDERNWWRMMRLLMEGRLMEIMLVPRRRCRPVSAWRKMREIVGAVGVKMVASE
jgi:hypothetical protein